LAEDIDRPELHKICKEALSFNKCIIFAAILDSYGKIIVGNWSNNARRTRDNLLPAITSMMSYGGKSGMKQVCPKIQFQMLKVGLRNRISLAHVDGNSNTSCFLVVYWRL
jgi:hypothetical protein